MGSGSIFYPLLLIVILIPNLLGDFLLPSPEVWLSTTLAVLGYLWHLKRVVFKPNKLFYAVLITLLVGYIAFNFSLQTIGVKLFAVANILIFFQLLSGDNYRSYLYTALLSFLNLTVVSLSFQNFLYGVLLFIYFLLLIYFFLLLAARSFGGGYGKKLERWLFKYSLLVFVGIFFAGSVLFFLLPRPNQPIFSPIAKKGENALGFSNELKPGVFTLTAQSSAVVFRAKITPGVAPSFLYWRGNTLEIYKKGVWLPYGGIYAEVEGYRPPLYEETLLLLPYGDKNLFSFGYPIKGFPSVFVNPSKGVAFLGKVPTQPVEVKLQTAGGVKVRLLKKELLLDVPPKTARVIRRFIRQNGINGKTPSLLVQTLARAFSRFRYSLSNRASTLGEFLFKYREGNCEFFASSGALIFRVLGYPARVVVGFLGGEYNPLTGYYVVRQRDAHAWVEFYANGTWIIFDGTRYASASPNVAASTVENLRRNKLLLLWDTLNTIWLEYVVNLDRQKQIKLLRVAAEEIRQEGGKYLSTGRVLKLFIAVTFVVVPAGLFLFRRHLLALYFKLRYGVDVPPLSPAELYNHLWKHHPEILKREGKLLKKLIGLSYRRY